MKRWIGLLVVAIACALGGARIAGAGAPPADDYGLYDARVTDVKGVTTDLHEFGYAAGVNILMAYRGEADIEIPWRLIQRLDIGEYVRETRRAPCTVLLRSGKTIAIELDAIEEDRLLKGNAEFGEFRIRVGKLRRLELFGASSDSVAP